MAQPNNDYQLAAPGATFAAKLTASGAEAYDNVPKDAGLISAIATQEFTKGAATARHELWPWHVLAAVASEMYDDAGLTGYATDIIPLQQTLGATLADAEATGFFAGAVEHKRVSTLAAALGAHAAAKRAAGNVAPYVLDDTKMHDFQGAAIPQGDPAEVLNDLLAADISGASDLGIALGGRSPALLMTPALAYPFTSDAQSRSQSTSSAAQNGSRKVRASAAAYTRPQTSSGPGGDSSTHSLTRPVRGRPRWSASPMCTSCTPMRSSSSMGCVTLTSQKLHSQSCGPGHIQLSM